MVKFMKNLAVAALAIPLFATAGLAAGDGAQIKHKDWSFAGPFGTFDQAAMQRGFQSYQEVCSGCHSLKLVAFRNLADLGYNEAEIKAIAAQYDIVDGPDDDGEMFTRPGRPSDRFPSPYANEAAARASNNGALPPDLSLIVKARANGANYLYSLLSSYEEAPAGMAVPDGMHYNKAYGGNLIAMPQPLYGDDVTFADGADSSVEGISSDLVHFLAWASEPSMEKRKRTGVAVMLFLLVLVGVSYRAMRYIWADVKKA